MGIAYAEHPISKAQKEALLKQGFDKVLDIRFAPDILGDGDKRVPKKKKEKVAEEKAAADFSAAAPIDTTINPAQ